MIVLIITTGVDKFKSFSNHHRDTYKHVTNSETLEGRTPIKLDDRTLQLRVSIGDKEFKNEDNPYGYFMMHYYHHILDDEGNIKSFEDELI